MGTPGMPPQRISAAGAQFFGVVEQNAFASPDFFGRSPDFGIDFVNLFRYNAGRRDASFVRGTILYQNVGGAYCMARIRVGSVGIGGISRGVHLPGIAASSDLELAAVCDIREDALQAAQQAYGVAPERCFRDYRDLIACEDVDVVDISTPNDVHFEVAMAAAKAGKSFCVEKPLTLTAEQADALARAVEQAGVKTMVCFSYRYKAAARYARDLVRGGTLGKIYHVDMEYSQAWGLPQFGTPRVWRFHKAETGSGALGDLGSHALDLVRFVTERNMSALWGMPKPLSTSERRFLEMPWFLWMWTIFPICWRRCLRGLPQVSASRALAMGAGTISAWWYMARRVLWCTCWMKTVLRKIRWMCAWSLWARKTICLCACPVPHRYRVDQMQSFADILLGKADGLSATVADGRVNMHAVDAVLASAEKGAWVEIKP